MSKLSTSQYVTALGFLRDQVNALEPAQLVLPLENTFTACEGDRARVVKAVADLKVMLADAYAAAQRAAQ